jgi:hypothetical protein
LKAVTAAFLAARIFAEMRLVSENVENDDITAWEFCGGRGVAEGPVRWSNACP